MTQTLRWGILGTGNIARQFATGVRSSRCGALQAVGSRTPLAATTFAQLHHIPAAFPSYEQVLSSNDVDAVYIALPNTLHKEWTLKALHAGKHVLCEKPLAVNADQAQEMFDLARKTGRLLIEAFMYRTHPLTHAVIQAVRDGAIGQVRLIRTSFCYCLTRPQGNIRFNPDLAGGALMDVGCYCINFSRLFASAEPSVIHAVSHQSAGIDDLTTAALQFPNGILATFTCGMTVHADNTAHICGSTGYIEIPVPWKPPQQHALYTIAHNTPTRQDHPGQSIPIPPRDTRSVDTNLDVYAIEADAFAAAVFDSTPPWITPQDTLGNMRVLDTLRQQINLTY